MRFSIVTLSKVFHLQVENNLYILFANGKGFRSIYKVDKLYSYFGAFHSVFQRQK